MMVTNSFIDSLTIGETQELISRLSRHLSRIVKKPDAQERYYQLSAKMRIVTDIEFEVGRPYEGAVCRWIIGNQMKKEGYSYQSIGRAMKKNHATIMNGCRRLADMVAMPSLYPDEINLMNNFQKIL